MGTRTSQSLSEVLMLNTFSSEVGRWSSRGLKTFSALLSIRAFEGSWGFIPQVRRPGPGGHPILL